MVREVAVMLSVACAVVWTVVELLPPFPPGTPRESDADTHNKSEQPYG